MDPLFALALELKSTGVAEAKRDLAGLDRQGKTLASTFGILKSALAGIAVGALFKRAIDEAGDAERAMADLEQAVSNTGGNFNDLKVAAESAAERLQKFTRFSDDAAIGTIAKMTAITGDAGKAMRNLGLAADIAAFKHIGLEEAGLIVARVLTGNTRLLRELGINVKEGGDVMQQLRDKFGGFAEKEGATFQGRLAQLRNSFSDVLEAMGRVIIGGDGTADVMLRIRDKLADLAKYIDANAEKWRAWAKDTIQAVSDWYTGFKERADKVAHQLNVIAEQANLAGLALRAGFTGSYKDIDALIQQYKRLNAVRAEGQFADVEGGGSSSSAITNLPTVTIRGKVPRDKVSGSGKDKRIDEEERAQSMLRALREQAYEDLLRAAGRDDQADFYRIDREFNRRRDEIAKLKVSEQTKTDLLLAAAEERGAAQQRLDAEIWERIRKQREDQAKKDADAQQRVLEDEKKRTEQYANEIADVLVSSVTNAFSELFQGHGITASLKALGKGLLSGIGSILVMIGKQVIAASVIVQAAVAALLSLNPFAALAAGILLVALGSALGGVGGAGGGGGGSGGGYSRTSAASHDEVTRIKFVDSRTGNPVGNVTPKPPVHFTIIGQHDPAVQRQIVGLIDQANRRKS